jgi:beta-barrel assembly-enhancing protease
MMHKSAYRDLLILIVIGVALFGAGFYIVQKISVPDINLESAISVEQEEKLGGFLKDAVLQKYTLVEDNAADSAIQQITERLISSLDSSNYHYRISIIESDEINAFTLPGGNIFIFSGLIDASESPEEVAAVLAHEIGHAEQRHVVKKLTKELSITAIVAVLSGGDPSVITTIMKDLLSNTFSRDQEREADQFALALLEKSSVDPYSLATFFKRLNDKDLSYNKNLEIVMTHPHNDSRIEQVENYKTKPSFKQDPFEVNWESVKDSLE